MGTLSSVDEAADELYSGPLGAFVPRRDELAKQARSDGDRELSAGVAALRKPTVGAWLANLLAHQHPEQVQQLIELGAALREAQSVLDPDQLRALGRQRYQVVAELVALARRRAAELGQRTGDAAATELEGTLGAALSDPEAAHALVQGRLTHGLVYAGFGETGSTTATRAAPARAAGRPARAAPAKADPAERIDAAERALTQARLQAAEAAAEAAKAAEDVEREQAQVTDSESRVAQLTSALAAAEQALTALGTQLAAARKEQRRRADLANAAERKADDAARTVTALREE
jgi:hypothetical protein